MIMGSIETIELENELLESDWKRLTQLVHSIVDTAPPPSASAQVAPPQAPKQLEKSKAVSTNKQRHADIAEHKRALTPQAQHAINVIAKNNTEWASFVHDFVQQHGRLPDNDTNTWMLSIFLLICPEQVRGLADVSQSTPETRAELVRFARLCGGADLDAAWGAIEFPKADAPLWLVDGYTPVMRKEYIVKKLSERKKPDLPSIAGYSPLLNGCVTSKISNEFLDGGAPTEATPGVHVKLLERVTTPSAGNWTVTLEASPSVANANIMGSIRVSIRGTHCPIDIVSERKSFGKCTVVDTMCVVQEDPKTSMYTEVDLSEQTRKDIDERIYAMVKSSDDPKPNVCNDGIHRRLEIIGFPTEIKGDGTYTFKFALSVSKFDAARNAWMPDENTRSREVHHSPTMQLHLAFGRTRPAPRTYKPTSLLLDIDGFKTENQTGFVQPINGVRFKFSFEDLPELHRMRVRSVVRFAEMTNRPTKKPPRINWTRSTVNDARRTFLSPEELGDLQLVPNVESCSYVPPQAPPRATNTGLAFPHVKRLSEADRSTVQNLVFAGDCRRDIALDFRITLYGEDVCETAVVQALGALGAQTPHELLFDLTLVTTVDASTKLPIGAHSYSRTCAYEGIVTVFAQLTASTATAADDNPCKFLLTACHPHLAKTLIGESPPFFIGKHRHSVSDRPLDKYGGYLPGGVFTEVAIVDVANNINHQALRRCDSESGATSNAKGRLYTEEDLAALRTAFEVEKAIVNKRYHIELASAMASANKRHRKELADILMSIHNGEWAGGQIIEEAMRLRESTEMEDGTSAQTEILVPTPVFVIRYHKVASSGAHAEFRAKSMLNIILGVDTSEILAALQLASTVVVDDEEHVLYPFDRVYFKLSVVSANDNALLEGDNAACLTTDAGVTLSKQIVCTVDELRSVNLYKVPIKKCPIRLSLDVVTNTSELPIYVTTPRDDAAIATAFASNGLRTQTAYTDPFRVLVTVRK